MKILNNLPKNTLYYIAGAGAIIALFAFFFAPFAIEVVSYTYPSTSTSTSSSAKPLFTSQFAEKPTSVIGSATGNSTALAQVNGILWLDAVLVLAIIVVIALLLFRSHSPFGLANVPAEKQVLWARYGLVGAALLSLLILWAVFANAAQILQNNANNQITPGAGNSFPQSSVQFEAGAWLFLLGLLAVVVAIGVPLALQLPAQLAASRAARATRTAYPPAAQYPADQSYNQNANQYPPAYPPYPQSNTGQYPAPPQAYAPQEQYPPMAAYPPVPNAPAAPDSAFPPHYPQQQPLQGAAYPQQEQFPPTPAAPDNAFPPQYPPQREQFPPTPAAPGNVPPPQYPPQQP